ncbi:hypothetical protein BJX70DRAFT_404626 [Aspergillus crustosus]
MQITFMLGLQPSPIFNSTPRGWLPFGIDVDFLLRQSIYLIVPLHSPIDLNPAPSYPAGLSYINLEFQLHARGGHSSVPLSHTAIGIISELIVALEENPYTPVITANSPIHNRLICQSRYSPGTQPEIEQKLREGDFAGLAEEFANSSPLSRLVVQTSQAVDLIQGGVKINAMPEVVIVAVNYRVAHHEKPVDVQRRAIQVIDQVVKKYQAESESETTSHHDLKRDVEVDYTGTLVVSAPFKAEAVAVSPFDDDVWDVFSGTIQHAFAVDDGIVVPVGDVMTGGTDTRHYLGLKPNVYRWTPAVGRGLENIHTVDEKVKIYDHLQAITWLVKLVSIYLEACLVALVFGYLVNGIL